MIFARGLALAGLLAAGLLMTTSGCGKKEKDAASPSDPAKTKELLAGMWKHEKGKEVITLDFGAKTVKWKKANDGSGPGGEGTYSVVDAKTIEIPKLGAAFDEKVTVDSISADKLVLSGGDTWKFDKTEFVKQK